MESNVVNQCYSFLTTRSKSLPIIAKLLGSPARINSFYEILRQGRKKQTKYMGRSVLEDLALLEDDHPVYILHRKLRCRMTLKIGELRLAIKAALNYFLKKVIVSAILTSSKLDRTTVRQHLARAREILAFLNRPPPTD